MTARAIGHLLLAIAVATWAINPVLAEVPTSAPAEAGARISITHLFAQFSDPDPQKRDRAKQEMMSLRAVDLPALRDVVSSNLPLRPGIAQMLQDVVMQVYLCDHAEQENPADRQTRPGFMGVMMAASVAAIGTDSASTDDRPFGALVESRTPGFAAYQMLRNGDLIVAVATPVEPGDSRPPRMLKQPVMFSKNIIDIVSTLPAGQKIVVTVLRAGRKLDIELTLGARPPALPMQAIPGEYEQFIEVQAMKAAEYWNEHFAAIVDQFIL